MQDAMRQGLRAARPALLAGCCEVCRGWTAGRLCADCRTRFAAPAPRCGRCGLRVPDGLACCVDCQREPPPFERCICVADYAFPWDRLIGRCKYEQAPELAALLADCMAAAAHAGAAPRPDAFVALPLSAHRLAERGYDQAWELARRLGRRLGVPARARLLERRFDGPPQARLTRAQRLRNLQGAFVVPAAARTEVQGRHLALVDDVMTTGATAHEATNALRAAGAARVDLWVVARTPAPAGQA
jgi:ComF family protein